MVKQMIFKKKVDGVIEGVKYAEDGLIDWVRVYQRRDMVYTDVMVLPRSELLEELQRGKQYKTGRRVAYQGSSFETDLPVDLVKKNGDTYIQAGAGAGAGAQRQPGDHLEGVPIF
jgi:hypothetical protein